MFCDMMLCNIPRFGTRTWCLRRESITHRHSAISQENSILYLQTALFDQKVNSKARSLSVREHNHCTYCAQPRTHRRTRTQHTSHSPDAGAQLTSWSVQLTAPTTGHLVSPPQRYLHNLADTPELPCAAQGTREHIHRKHGYLMFIVYSLVI